MKSAGSLVLFVLAIGCTDEAPFAPSAGPLPRASSAASSEPPSVNTFRFKALPPLRPLNEPDSPGLDKVIITRVFDAVVIDIGNDGFMVQGASGRKYLLVPTQSFKSRGVIPTDLVGFEQLKVKDKLRVHLSWKIPYVSVYVCEGVQLHGAKLAGVTDLTPPGVRRDDEPMK